MSASAAGVAQVLEAESVRVERYQDAHRTAWDEFVRRSKNGVFLFLRDYMEYHRDRFADHSLLFLKGDEILAVLPANDAAGQLVSHGGLTFGGLVSGPRMRASTMLSVMDALIAHGRAHGFRSLVYKAVPHIYHAIPAEEDLYALSRAGAALVRRDVSCAIDLANALPYSKGRKWGVKRAAASGVEVAQSHDFASFMVIEAELLASKYGTRPVHTAEEIARLAAGFPDNIRLFGAFRGGRMIAGTILYGGERVVHTQYIAATEEGKELCALDLVIDRVIREHCAGRRWFDFGISTEQNGLYLNVGLMENKESYGARAVVHDFYELPFA